MALRRSPKPGAFTAGPEAAAALVDDQGRERFAFDVFRHDQERTRGLHNGFQDRQQRLQLESLLFVDEDCRGFWSSTVIFRRW